MTDEERNTWNRIKAIARRRVANETDRSDVMQIAWVYTRTRKTTPWYAVSEAIRTHFSTDTKILNKEVLLTSPDHIASHYRFDSQIESQEALEIAEEENERHFKEWKHLPASEKRLRILESYAGTQTLLVD